MDGFLSTIIPFVDKILDKQDLFIQVKWQLWKTENAGYRYAILHHNQWFIVAHSKQFVALTGINIETKNSSGHLLGLGSQFPGDHKKHVQPVW